MMLLKWMTSPVELLRARKPLAHAIHEGVEAGLRSYACDDDIRPPRTLAATVKTAGNARIHIDLPDPQRTRDGLTQWHGTALVETYTKGWQPSGVLVGELTVVVPELPDHVTVRGLQLVVTDSTVTEAVVYTFAHGRFQLTGASTV